MPLPNKPVPGKRRIRKRKRRQAASSSSSSPSSSSSSSGSESDSHVTASPTAIPTAPAGNVISEQSPSSDSDSTPSASDAGSVRGAEDARMARPQRPSARRPQSRSPSPPNRTIPPLVTLHPTTDEEKQRDAQLREKFRKFWMASVADAFKDDLEKIQKEPNLSQSRLGLLIDSLAAGAELYIDGKSTEEVRMVLGE